ncbi:Antitoxin Phd_YefM, type II toxin-antitoxin system [Pasteurella testudinis DSM 23072]|uniref:Antitoxin Phd_YefM, type II toxin-antitoxin system n=1 Tax=Pasteurella testudinis DSM 23072 TaxID=1122938 RepID=A0A1W1UFY4_9PAST|nr:hypothetical protein [Pasteurella testudinis]SMB79949.1 Antitoxin Phd_YefM, type II toxin-antitoxin system [Pasteurella testudinis DSM 23072]SUB50639.1 Uncharacterised protein [Pasteurella testudinis]
MTVITMTSREFNHEVGKAKRYAQDAGAVFITDRGATTHVLVSIEAYRHLQRQPTDILTALAMPGLSEIELETERSVLFDDSREVF